MAHMSPAQPADHLVWRRAVVDGRSALYGEAGGRPGTEPSVGRGAPDERGTIDVVFLHGWGLGQHAYKRALKRLVRLGCRVLAPALPGFGGSAELPAEQRDLAGYAAWVEQFCAAVGLNGPAVVVGHSFGGGVAIQLAHDHPKRVGTLVLVNSIGGSAWTSGAIARSMAERPLWDWGIHLPRDVLPVPQLTRVLPVILEDLLPNLARNPRAIWRVAGLARRADLSTELAELRRRRLPVVVLWGEQDRIIPRASFDALCAAIGAKGEVVPGNHSWLLADPDAFAEVMTNVVEVARAAQALGAADRTTGAGGRAGGLLGGLVRRRRAS
ncbi:MAG: alpha/beta fold hydrolase [Acidimicrobiales bacterium]